MKKWFYAMLVAILPAFAMSLTSCDNDDNLPNVDISMNLSEGVVSDGVIYVVQGDTIQVSGLTVKNLEANKNAGLTNVSYYWDGYYYQYAPVAPYAMIFPTTDQTAVGSHNIGISCTVLAVDKSIAIGAVNFPVKVVASEADLPVSTQGGTITATTQSK